jgi:hypothetical protein
MEDAILKEAWAVKDRIAAKYHGNIKKYMNDLRKAHAHSLAANAPPHKSATRSKRKTA